MVRDFQHVIGAEAREQFIKMTGELPDTITTCVEGGSNAMGIFSGFINDLDVKLIGVEPSGRSLKIGDHSASLRYGKPGILHGF